LRFKKILKLEFFFFASPPKKSGCATKKTKKEPLR